MAALLLLEATISGKPIITYLPFDKEDGPNIPNELGERVVSLEALSKTVSRLFDASHERSRNEKEQTLPDLLQKSISGRRRISC